MPSIVTLVLFIGTGVEIARPPPAFRSAMDEADIGVESMASATACRTCNVLPSEGPLCRCRRTACPMSLSRRTGIG